MEAQILTCNGKLMVDEEKAIDSGVGRSSTMGMTTRLYGGMFNLPANVNIA